jgi:hypothetical protein
MRPRWGAKSATKALTDAALKPALKLLEYAGSWSREAVPTFRDLKQYQPLTTDNCDAALLILVFLQLSAGANSRSVEVRSIK